MSSASPASQAAEPGPISWTPVVALLAVCGGVLAAALAATFPLSLAGFDPVLLGRVLFAAGCGACLGVAGAARLGAGEASLPALGDLKPLAAASGAAGGAWLAAAFVSPDLVVVAGMAGAVLGAAAGLATVRAIDRPNPATNLVAAAAVPIALGLGLATVAYTAGQMPELAGLITWLWGDLASATVESGLAMLAIAALATAATLARPSAGPSTAIVATAACWAAAGPLAGIVGTAPRLVRRISSELPGGAFALASGVTGAAIVVGIDALARMLLGGFDLPFNLAVLLLAPVWLLWNRARLRTACGPAALPVRVLEALLIAALTLPAVLVVLANFTILRAVY